MEEEPIAGIVLASGMSHRFGRGNKLVVPLRGDPVVRRTVRAYLDGGLAPVLVVVGHQAGRVTSALTGLPVTIVQNPDFAQGQSRALVQGVRAIPSGARAAVVGVGDQPLLSAAVIEGLIAAYRATGPTLVVPRYGGRRGNPVLFDGSLFGELLGVEGDQGGRPVLERHHAEIAWVDVTDPSAGWDLDTEEDYTRLRSRRTHP